MRRLLITLAFMLLATNAVACMAEVDPTWRDTPISVASDGSFKHAEDEAFSQLFGDKIVNLGDGRIAQRITSDHPCGLREFLLFADCRQANVVEVVGAENPDQPAGWGDDLVDLIQVPIGAIDVRKIASVEELISIAYENDYRINLNVERRVANMKRRNRYDPFNGCKLYYPDSPGAKL